MMATSAVPDGQVVSVPRSRTDRTPKIREKIDSLGMPLGGGRADREKGSPITRSSDSGSDSRMVRMVARVPPLAPDVLHPCLVCVCAQTGGMAYFISSMADTTSLGLVLNFSRTVLTTDQERISAGALSIPVDGMI